MRLSTIGLVIVCAVLLRPDGAAAKSPEAEAFHQEVRLSGSSIKRSSKLRERPSNGSSSRSRPSKRRSGVPRTLPPKRSCAPS